MKSTNQQPLTRIRALLGEGRHRQACLVLDELPPHGADGIAARLMIAEALIPTDPEMSIHFLQSVVASDARLFHAWVLLGIVHQQRGNLLSAVDAYAAAFNRRPDNTDVAGRYEEALRALGRQTEADNIKCEHVALVKHDIANLPIWPGPLDLLRNNINEAAHLYLDLLEKSVANWIYRDPHIAAGIVKEFDPWRREWGKDIPTLAHTMIGLKRLRHLRYAVETVLSESVPGDVMEAGVWRGGACILMRGVLAAWGDTERSVWVADLFAGLPPPDPRYEKDAFTLFDFHQRPELAASLDSVRDNFARYDLLDDRVHFVKGLFRDTLPALMHLRLAILRLDGDFYSSTMDVLVNLYDRLAPGGFVIVDDYGVVIDARRAVLDFREARDIREPMMAIDGDGIFWRKTEKLSAAGNEPKTGWRLLRRWFRHSDN